MSIDLEELYRDLHAHPELSFQESRTADVVARHLHEMGFVVHPGIGQTGVFGVLDNGPTLTLGVQALVLAAREYLDGGSHGR